MVISNIKRFLYLRSIKWMWNLVAIFWTVRSQCCSRCTQESNMTSRLSFSLLPLTGVLCPSLQGQRTCDLKWGLTTNAWCLNNAWKTGGICLHKCLFTEDIKMTHKELLILLVTKRSTLTVSYGSTKYSIPILPILFRLPICKCSHFPVS